MIKFSCCVDHNTPVYSSRTGHLGGGGSLQLAKGLYVTAGIGAYVPITYLGYSRTESLPMYRLRPKYVPEFCEAFVATIARLCFRPVYKLLLCLIVTLWLPRDFTTKQLLTEY